MKKLYILLAALLISFTIHAQIVDIPDANFKNALVNTLCVDTDDDFIYDNDADTNDDGEIQINEAEAVLKLNVANQSIASLEGIENFINLQRLSCSNNELNALDFTLLTNLKSFNCNNNPLTILDTNNLPNLEFISCYSTTLSTLIVDNLPNLKYLICYEGVLETLTLGYSPYLTELDCNSNQITELDLSGTPNLEELYCWNNQITFIDLSNKAVNTYYYSFANNQIETLLVKNGSEIEDMIAWDFSEFDFSNNPLTYVCGDENELELINGWLAYHEIENCAVNSYCSFVPGGDYFAIEGNAAIDLDENGCDTDDVVYPYLNFLVTNGSETGDFIANSSGAYTIPLQEGSHTITPTFENPNYFSISPSSLDVNFPTDVSPFTQDFCITPNDVFNDLEITIIPLELARPGFDTNYKVIYKNKGTTTLSGGIDFGFQDEVMEFVTSTPPNESGLTDLLSYSFTDLLPFESREINLTMNLNSPMETPPLNDGDELTFITSISSSETDETPDDNTFELHQTVVNSFDPNDKTCLEGSTITPEMVGDFVHYMIRFENTGSAEAINIVVKDDIDRTTYDLSSLVPLHASHDYVARIKDNASNYYVEFIFENINLPFDDANNDGYIVFKIRTLDTLALNDTFENDAEIYFDFNFPIITNNEQTTIATLSTEEFELANNSISLYPNPTTSRLNIASKQAINQIDIYDISGRHIKEIAVIGTKTELTMSTEDLSTGTYFVKIKTSQGEIVRKVIKD